MQVNQVYLEAVKGEYIDLQAIILFLYMEKGAISLEDDVSKLEYYMRDQFKGSMNEYITAFKEKQNMKYKPNVYELLTFEKKIYVLAYSEQQAETFVRNQYNVTGGISVIPLEEKFHAWNRMGDRYVTTAKDLRDRAERVPALLGGY